MHRILPELFVHLENNVNSRIVRFFGIHAIKPAIGEVVYVIVMQNIFSASPPDEIYDLKGSTVSRRVGGDIKKGKTYKDIDFMQNARHLDLNRNQRDALQSQLLSDARFLCDNGIMDYSILVGIHRIRDDEQQPAGVLRSRHGEFAYCVGIIDVLQLWDFNKKLERFTKVVLMRKSRVGISAIDPERYFQRFGEFVRTSFFSDALSVNE